MSVKVVNSPDDKRFIRLLLSDDNPRDYISIKKTDAHMKIDGIIDAFIEYKIKEGL